MNTCDCPIHRSNQNQNDSLINALKINYSKQSVDYWEIRDEPKLYDLTDKSYRFRHEDWMAGIDKIYRVSKIDSKYYLFFKEYTEVENLNEFGTSDSLIIFHEIPLKDNDVNKIDLLYESSCFWTYPIKKPTKRKILHAKIRLLEIFDPDLNKCTQKTYHYMEMEENAGKGFELVIREFEEIVRSYVSKK